MSTTLISSAEPCGCDDTCGTFVNSIELLPPSTGYTCPYRVVMGIKFPAVEPDTPECNKVVCRVIACDETLIAWRDKLIAQFGLPSST